MGNWFGKGKKGVLMGIWTGNSNLGNILGYFIGHIVMITYALDWEYAIMITAVYLIATALFLVFFLRTAPENRLIINKLPDE